MRNIICAALLALAVAAAEAADVSPQMQPILEQATAGDAEAQFKLGSAYDSGQGVPRNGEAAMLWYRRAAEQGHAEAQNSVGSGLQAEKKFSEALQWYEKASAQGHALATNNLAYLYDLGLGVQQDRARGLELYGKAADLGWAEAMWNMANMYGGGQVGEKDLFKGCIWTLRAQRYASANAVELKQMTSRTIPYLRKNLSSSEYSRCERDAMAWAPKVRGTP